MGLHRLWALLEQSCHRVRGDVTVRAVLAERVLALARRLGKLQGNSPDVGRGNTADTLGPLGRVRLVQLAEFIDRDIGPGLQELLVVPVFGQDP